MASNLRVDTILPSSGTNVAIGTASGTVSLIGDSNLTTSGNLTIGGDLGVGGTLTYEDVTNIDSVGLITARSGVNVSGGEVKVGTAVTVSSGGVITSGIVTATNVSAASSVTAATFHGSGAGLTGTGKVVGFAFASSSTNEQNTSGNQTWTLVGPQITYTAASTSNKLVFLHTHHLMIEGSMHWHMALYRDGTSGTKVYEMQTYTQLGANWSACTGITNVAATPPDTSSHTYQFAIYRNGGSDGLIRYSPNSASTGSQITMLEIQP